MTPTRWNQWLKLSPQSRKSSDPREYAKGKSVAAQRMDAKREQAAAKILNAFPAESRPGTVRRGVRAMDTSQLNAVLKRDGAKLREYIRTQARNNTPGKLNPFWYR